MTHVTFPKPAKRQPKPKKPLPRSKGFIKRGRPARVRRTPRGQEQESLNRLFSRVIRDRDPLCVIRLCNPGHSWALLPAASTEAAHLYGKKAHPKIRWDMRNAVGACSSCHRWMTDHPRLWAKWRDEHLHVLTVERLMWASNHGPSPDREKVRAELTAALKALKP